MKTPSKNTGDRGVDLAGVEVAQDRLDIEAGAVGVLVSGQCLSCISVPEPGSRGVVKVLISDE
jgi:hypothetical protein